MIRRKSARWLLALVAGVLVAVGCAAGDSNGGVGQTDSETTLTDSNERPVALGRPARDGKFEFVVTGVTYRSGSIGNEFGKVEPQGRFALVSVNVSNIGDEPQSFMGAQQKAFDAKGREFTNDSEAEVYANQSADTFLTYINPGNATTGVVVFDVPNTVTLVRVQLHDSVLSGGVEVSLR